MEEAQPSGGLVLPFRRHDEGHARVQEPTSPFGVMPAGPADAPEQHHAQFRLADELQAGVAVDAPSGIPGELECGFNRLAVCLSAVHRQGEPQRQAAGAPGHMQRILAGVDLLGPDLVVGGVLGQGRRRELRPPEDQRRGVDRREQPFVRVDHQRVGVLDPGEAATRAGREQGRSAVGGIHVEPQVPLGGDRGHAVQIIDDPGVGGAGGRHDGDHGLGLRVPGECGMEGLAGQPVIVSGNLQRVGADDVQRLGDRGVGLAADRHPRPPASQARRQRPAVAGRHQGGEVGHGPAGYEAAARGGRQPGVGGEDGQGLVFCRYRPRVLQGGNGVQAENRD